MEDSNKDARQDPYSINLMEYEEGDLTKEGKLLWTGDIDQVPSTPYLKIKQLPWSKKPPILPKHFSEFGERILKLIEDQLLTMWALDRAGLYAILAEHSYPRDISDIGGRRKLSYEIASNPNELRWAAAWLMYKREGGSMDLEETEMYPIKVEKMIPEEFQKLQTMEKDKLYHFTTGQISLKTKIMETAKDKADLIKILGMQKLQLTKTLNLMKSFYKDIESLKKKEEKRQADEDKISLLSSVDKGMKSEETSAQLTQMEEKIEKKLGAIETTLKDQSTKVSNLQEWILERQRKAQARRFYKLRKRQKKKLKKNLGKVPEALEEQAEEDEEDEDQEPCSA
jgi:hypothetical protein